MDFSPRGLAFLCRERERERESDMQRARDRQRKIEREGDRYVLGENTVGAQETESSHPPWLVTMGMLYIVIHFLSTFPPFLFWDDPMREEKCCTLDSR